MIIGLTGSLAAGKGVVADFLKKKGFVYLSLSDELREIMKENKVQITRENLQIWGNKLREEQGSEVLAKRAVNKIKTQEYKRAVVDGIRNPAEVEFLEQNLKHFFLVAVDAPIKVRFDRMVIRSRESDPIKWEDFVKVDKKDKGFGEKESGQGVGKCMARAKFVLINDGGLEDVEKKISILYGDIERQIPRPTWDEYFMDICRAVATRATCNRGRSGCVIAKNKQILVSGYVGSPKGLPHCDEVGHQMKTVTHGDGSQTQHCLRTAHAEQNAICQAAKLGISIDGAMLYCKMTPCSACAKMIINAGIKRVVCEKKYQTGNESEEMFKVAGVELVTLFNEVEKY